MRSGRAHGVSLAHCGPVTVGVGGGIGLCDCVRCVCAVCFVLVVLHCVVLSTYSISHSAAACVYTRGC